MVGQMPAAQGHIAGPRSHHTPLLKIFKRGPFERKPRHGVA